MRVSEFGGDGGGGKQLAAAVVMLLLFEAAAEALPDQSVGSLQDPENPDFHGMIDFSNAVPGPDGAWCITKVKYVDHMENDQVKECWHQNVTQCHETYITEFLSSQEQKCEETFWKSCKIDFKEVPFNYTLKQCHTPLIKKCDDYQSDYGAPKKTVCRTWFESECNTTYVESRSGSHKPNTWCQKKPRKICAPDNCNMVQGPEDCRDKVMVSTIQKPEEHCSLQPQQHCRLITKLVPHLTTKEVCKDIPKEICVMKLVNPHPVRKPIQLKWCTRTQPSKTSYKPAPQPTYNKPAPAPSGYLPPPSNSIPTYSPPQQYKPSSPYNREDSEPFVITVDGQTFNNLEELPIDIQQLSLPVGPPSRDQFRPDNPRYTRHIQSPKSKDSHVKVPHAFPHMKPGHNAFKPARNSNLRASSSQNNVHIVRPAEIIGNEEAATAESSQTETGHNTSHSPLPTPTSPTTTSSPSSTSSSSPKTAASFRPSQQFSTPHRPEGPPRGRENIEFGQKRSPRHHEENNHATSASLRSFPGSIL